MNTNAFPAIISIHDVMPHTLDRVDACLAQTQRHELGSIILLVVPGLAWRPRDKDRLKAWVDAGHILAGHGWIHDSGKPRKLWHRIHSALISRQVAEHLALEADGIVDLMSRCRQWFDDEGFDKPELYVPPAWAMGSVPRARLASTGFDWFEYQQGLYDAKSDRLYHLPVLGFEADTRVRAGFLRYWNRFNAARGSAQRPARLSIHPDDQSLLLASQLDLLLARCKPVGLQALTHAA